MVVALLDPRELRDQVQVAVDVVFLGNEVLAKGFGELKIGVAGNQCLGLAEKAQGFLEPLEAEVKKCLVVFCEGVFGVGLFSPLPPASGAF
jgi:hypothetical protein